MANQQDIEKAVKLVDKMVNLSAEERRMLKQRIPEAAQKNERALEHIVHFLYDRKNRDTTSKILFLILRERPSKRE